MTKILIFPRIFKYSIVFYRVWPVFATSFSFCENCRSVDELKKACYIEIG